MAIQSWMEAFWKELGVSPWIFPSMMRKKLQHLAPMNVLGLWLWHLFPHEKLKHTSRKHGRLGTGDEIMKSQIWDHRMVVLNPRGMGLMLFDWILFFVVQNLMLPCETNMAIQGISMVLVLHGLNMVVFHGVHVSPWSTIKHTGCTGAPNVYGGWMARIVDINSMSGITRDLSFLCHPINELLHCHALPILKINRWVYPKLDGLLSIMSHWDFAIEMFLVK